MNPEEIRKENAKQIYQNRLPIPLKPPKDAASPTKEEKKVESKEEVKEVTNQEQSQTAKKDETSYDLGTSEMEQSDDYKNKKLLELQKEKLEKDLNQEIYISICETPTNIMFYCPSTKYLTLKNGKIYFFLIFSIFYNI